MNNKTLIKICIASLLVFFSILILAEIYPQNNLDKTINSDIALTRTPALTSTMLFISNIMDPIYVVLYMLIISAFLFFKKQKSKFIFSILAMSFVATVEALKLIIGRIRPENILVIETNSSFPSGHATMSLIFFGLLIYLFKDSIKNKTLKYILIAISILLILLIGFSRIYLGAHWFTDITAGYSLGLFWLSFLALIFNLKK